MSGFKNFIKKVKVPGSSGKGRRIARPGKARTYRPPRA